MPHLSARVRQDAPIFWQSMCACVCLFVQLRCALPRCTHLLAEYVCMCCLFVQLRWSHLSARALPRCTHLLAEYVCMCCLFVQLRWSHLSARALKRAKKFCLTGE
ncbi:hypothetical protein GBAR_LOCUS26500 [Geodia barretti]|uniref:Uncharacterized protein n=1 Tax=Geodia barretti TaxID=519541 RepID=A0AA35THR9_GEOBA|nr:hypothetical protein GBAR_LOCUS26500 [Geodia barretti]